MLTTVTVFGWLVDGCFRLGLPSRPAQPFPFSAGQLPDISSPGRRVTLPLPSSAAVIPVVAVRGIGVPPSLGPPGALRSSRVRAVPRCCGPNPPPPATSSSTRSSVSCAAGLLLGLHPLVACAATGLLPQALATALLAAAGALSVGAAAAIDHEDVGWAAVAALGSAGRCWVPSSPRRTAAVGGRCCSTPSGRSVDWGKLGFLIRHDQEYYSKLKGKDTERFEKRTRTIYTILFLSVKEIL